MASSAEGEEDAESHPPMHDRRAWEEGDERATHPARDNGDDDSSSSSGYSSVSADSLPPIHEYGHRYHGSGQLMIPIDEAEDRRLNLQHQLYSVVLDGKLTATKLPIPPSTKPGPAAADNTGPHHQAAAPRPPFAVLDAGAGNGAWAVDMALAHPDVSVLGVDITPALLPKAIPPNLNFEIADLAEPWPPGHFFDFVYMRNLNGGGIRDWPSLLRSAFAQLRPGGQLEYAEMRPRFVDPSAAGVAGQGVGPEVGKASREFERAFGMSCQKLGLDPDPTPKISRWLTDMGAEGVKEQVHYMPMCPSGNDQRMRERGEVLSLLMEDALELLTLRIFCKAGWDEQEVRQMLDKVTQETQDPSLGSLVQINFITGRKP